jgi:hypothetical protein
MSNLEYLRKELDSRSVEELLREEEQLQEVIHHLQVRQSKIARAILWKALHEE